MSDKTILYYSEVCPYAQRARIAFREAGIDHEEVEIDLLNKPDWYLKINPEGKVPAVIINKKPIAESMVLVELANDLSNNKLLPEDPVQRAEIRLAIELFSSKIIPAMYGFFRNPTKEGGEDYKKTIEAGYKTLSTLLHAQSSTGPYFLGDTFSTFDIAVAPFIVRFNYVQSLFLDDYVPTILKEDSRLREFIEGVISRPTVKDTQLSKEKFAHFLEIRFNVPSKI
ncbi:thioredoxin-like protein [Pilobolus umbonatus]|nr:thioredoxin-like protein [Pilobolus umbonatus]